MNAQIYDEAGEWIVRNRDTGLDAQERRKFDAWLRQSPQHVRAYLEISSMWEKLGSQEFAWDDEEAQLVARARAEDNVVTLVSSPSRPVSTFARRRGIRWAALAAAIVLAAAGVWFYDYRNVYTTAVGEERSISLSDGSTIQLNARSRLRVEFSDHGRRIELSAGQALFRVAKDTSRPFTVHSGALTVRAIGTQFDVYKRPNGTVVTVVEGRVAVVPDSPAGSSDTSPVSHAKPALLAAGDQLALTSTDQPVTRRANVAAATAWTHGNLVFEFSPLAEVVREFNRYNTRPLVIEDPRLASFVVNGVFSSSDPSLLIHFLRAQPDLTVEETDTDVRISRR